MTMNWGWNEYLATIVNMLLNFVTEFVYQRFYVFGKSLDTNEAANNAANKRLTGSESPATPLDEPGSLESDGKLNEN